MITRPSSLPIHAVSPKWESSGGSDATIAGQDRHLAFAELITDSKPNVFGILSVKDQDTVAWAAEIVLDCAGLEGQVVHSEIPVDVHRDGIKVLSGTADAIVGNHLFDLKSGERNYREQMCAYALGAMQRFGFNAMVVHVLYGETRNHEQFTVTREECENTVFPILDKVADFSVECAVSEYCSWCKHQTTCPVVLKHVDKIANCYEMIREEDFGVAHPDQIARALNLAKVAGDWADAIKDHAKNMALSGVMIPGYELKERAGAKEIGPEHINTAFERMQIQQDYFLRACKVSVAKLIDQVTEMGTKRKDAIQLVNDRLIGLVEQKPAVKYLSKIK